MNMDSFSEATRFTYNPNANPESEDAFSGILEIHVHHARNIHNICIYDNQDVYAKFSLTCNNPEETLSTRIIHGGGKNPQFDEDLIMKIKQVDAVLKCEIWMMSRAKNFMDDQLLGFALVPISSVLGKGKITQDFDLSSTDLFHSPAGTINLSLTLNAKSTPIMSSCSLAHVDDHSVVDLDSSATSQLLMDDEAIIIPEEDDYSRIEFPDMNIVNENRQMVYEFFAKNNTTLLRPWLEKPDGSFLHLGAVPLDDDVAMQCLQLDSVSPDGSIQNSGFLSSTMTSMSDNDRNSADSMEKKRSLIFTDLSTFPNTAETSTSKKKNEAHEENEPNVSGKDDQDQENNREVNKNPVGIVRSIKIEAEESAMQQQIVDMYMRSMHQFTESLAKMKLPMDLDKRPQSVADYGDDDNGGDVIQNPDSKIEIENKKKDNSSSRVFYGSRAFF